MKYIDTPPFAPVLMESTRALGYSLESAIADIIDNSISAGASTVDIDFPPHETMPYISILDDGCGMSDEEIDNAMRYGSQSSLSDRNARDLGRFGLGMKTASLSQCRCLTVVSKIGRKVVARRWDLDEVYSRGSWALMKLESDDLNDLPDIYQELLKKKSGTLVIWQKLDRLLNATTSPEKLMSRQMEYVGNHLSLVFHRYLSSEKGISPLQIRKNGLAIEPKDPFLVGKSTQYQDDEQFSIDNQNVSVCTYLLPHINKLTNQEKNSLGGTEGLTKDQGFYIYRNKRLLVWGTWFRMHRKDEMSKYARIRVDIPNSLDHLWTLDIRKSSAVPPDILKSHLSRIIDRVTKGSFRVVTVRGKRETDSNTNHLWTKLRLQDGGVQYSLNREHPYLEMLRGRIDAQDRNILESYLKLTEDNIPLNQLYIDLNNEERVNVRKENELEREAMLQLKDLLGNVQNDPNRNDYIQLLLLTVPFCKFKSTISLLKRELAEHE